MKILMVSSFLPYPLFSGGQVRLYNLIKELSEKHEITLICEKRDNQTTEDVRQVEKFCKKVITVKRRKQWSLRNILKTSVSKNSFLLNGHNNHEMKDRIKEEIKSTKFDLLHVETYYVMQNLPKVSIPVVLAEHNIEYQVYKKYVDQAPFFLKPLLSLDIKKIKKEERECWSTADKVIAVSEDDKKIMQNAGITPSIVANGVDTEKFSYKLKAKSQELKEAKLLFIGDFKWIQNVDSARFIIEEVWPELELRIKNKELSTAVKLWVVGRNIPESIRGLTSDPNIIFDEGSSKKPTEEIFQEADILLSPIRVGGGTSYKILESMSCGTPVVITSLSASAIDARDGDTVMIGKNAVELAEKTIELLQNNSLYEEISKNARKLIEERYTWKKIAVNLDDVYKELRINPFGKLRTNN